jgi:hypothetical protein
VRTVKNTSHRRRELFRLESRGKYGELLVKQLGWCLSRDDVEAGWRETLKNGLCGMPGDVIKHLLILTHLCKFRWRHIDDRAERDVGCVDGDHQPPDGQSSPQATVVASVVIAVEKLARLERQHAL